MKKWNLIPILILVVLPSSRLWFEGSSTLHSFRADATTMNISADQLTVPVAGLTSDIVGMDGPMRAALKIERFPNILFKVIRRNMDVYGTLEIAGKKQTVTIPGQFSSESNRSRFTGSKELLMTDFGIDPPTFFWVLNTDNKVVVYYDIIF